MTRLVKVDWDAVEREYVYDASRSPVSYTTLAERHEVARSAVADHATSGRWPEKREKFRKALGIKATEALGEEWVKFEAAVRERVNQIGLKVLIRFEQQLADPDFKVSTRDMLGVAAMLHTYASSAAAAVAGEEVKTIDPDSHVLDLDTARAAIAAIERTERARLGPGEPDAAADAEAERAADDREG